MPSLSKHYDITQRKDVVTWFIESRSVTGVQRQFARKYGEKPPSYKTIKSLCNRFDQYGSLEDRPRTGRPRRVRSDDNIAKIRDSITNNPLSSVRMVSSDTGISRSRVHVILRHDLLVKPYKCKVLHELKETDYEARERFSADMLCCLNDDPELLSHILFSDEAYFYLDRSVVSKNVRYWSNQNPHIYCQHPLQAQRVLVWCGMSEDRIIGPYFFETPVNRANYLQMLRSYLVPALRRRNALDITVFQQDGAAPHTARDVLAWLQTRFPAGVISLRTDRPWPARSPDLNPLDFYLWGALKEEIKTADLSTLDTMKIAIRNAIRSINRQPEVLRSVISNFKFRLNRCLERNGRHIEHVL